MVTTQLSDKDPTDGGQGIYGDDVIHWIPLLCGRDRPVVLVIARDCRQEKDFPARFANE